MNCGRFARSSRGSVSGGDNSVGRRRPCPGDCRAVGLGGALRLWTGASSGRWMFSSASCWKDSRWPEWSGPSSASLGPGWGRAKTTRRWPLLVATPGGHRQRSGGRVAIRIGPRRRLGLGPVGNGRHRPRCRRARHLDVMAAMPGQPLRDGGTGSGHRGRLAPAGRCRADVRAGLLPAAGIWTTALP